MLTAAAGFFLAAKGNVHLSLLLATLAGIALVIASACVCNNYIDRGIDAKMARTKKRAMVRGIISGRNAVMYAAALGIIGFMLLAVFVNLLTLILGLLAFVVYVALYGILKRRSTYGTLVGSIAGALPPVAGYTAVTNHLDIAALLLFIILVTWQMPHFYAIALYRRTDYVAAGLPVLPVISGPRTVKIHIFLYIIGFTLACALLTVFNYTGYAYLAVAMMLSFGWLWFSARGFIATDDTVWARGTFLFSLLVICLLSVAISLGPLLP